MRELAEENSILYMNFIRLHGDLSNQIAERVPPHGEKSRALWRGPLEPALRVAVTLRFLETINSYKDIGYFPGPTPLASSPRCQVV